MPDPAIAAHVVITCPWSWEELALHWQQAQRLQQPLALAYPLPQLEDLDHAWRQWLGVLRSLAQRSQPVRWSRVSDCLGWPVDFMRTSLQIGEPLGYHWQISSEGVLLTWPNWAQLDWQTPQVRQTHHQWQRLLREWQRQRQFFGEASLQTLAAGLHDRYNLRTSEPA